MDYITDYSNATDRINKALGTLKDELMELRNQDVELMKQLLNISETIRELSPKTSHSSKQKAHPYRSGTRSCIGLNAISSSSLTELPHSRLLSVPAYCTNYNSSAEDINSSTDDCSFGSESDLDDFTHVQMRNKSACGLTRAHSMSLTKIRTSIGKLVEDSCYEEMLIRNIKLWKFKISGSRDSVFQEEENENVIE